MNKITRREDIGAEEQIEPEGESKADFWTCEIGEIDRKKLPHGADRPLRKAVIAAYEELTGQEPDFCSSGWGGSLSRINDSD